jgi:hydrogenase maturation protease
MTKTLVIGLGNPILTDDGVGIFAARHVEAMLPQNPSVDVIELSVGGLSLMEAMVGYERVILIDALWTPQEDVGQVVVFDAGELPETLNVSSSHDTNLATALDMGRSLGAPLPTDNRIQIVAVTANNVLEFGDEPTPPVKAVIGDAARAVLGLLAAPVA